MQVSVNGEMKTLDNGTTVAELLAQLGITGGRYAVEVDREIVPKAEHATTELAEGSKVEIVTFVGGG